MKRVALFVVPFFVTMAMGMGTVNAASTRTTVSSDKIDAAKQRGEKAIDTRLTTLDNLQKQVLAADYLTSDHRESLFDTIAKSSEGLRTLREQIGADTTLAQLTPHLASITRDYRVYVIVEPQVHLVRAGDATNAATAKMQTVVTELTNASKKLHDAGKNTTAVDADIAAASASLKQASGDADGQASKVLALKAADWPGKSSTLNSARDSLSKAAVADANAAQSLGKAATEISNL